VCYLFFIVCLLSSFDDEQWRRWHFVYRCSNYETEIHRLRIMKPVRVCQSCHSAVQLHNAASAAGSSSWASVHFSLFTNRLYAVVIEPLEVFELLTRGFVPYHVLVHVVWQLLKAVCGCSLSAEKSNMNLLLLLLFQFSSLWTLLKGTMTWIQLNVPLNSNQLINHQLRNVSS